MLKNVLILIMVTTGLFSCGQTNKPTPKTVDIETSNSVKNIQNDKESFSKYEYTDSNGKSIITQNSFPKGGTKYTDPDGKEYTYGVVFTRIINETNNPLELKINFPVDSFELPSIPGQYFKLLLPPDTMTLDKEPLFNYGLPDLKSFLDNNRNKSTSLNRTIDSKESSGFYVINLNIKPKSGWRQANGARRAGLSFKEQNLFYRTINVGSQGNTILSDIEIRCGSINLKKLTLKK